MKGFEAIQEEMIRQIKAKLHEYQVELACCSTGDSGLLAITGKNSTCVIEISYEELQTFEKKAKKMKASEFKQTFKHQRQDEEANFKAISELHVFKNTEVPSRKGRPGKKAKLSASDKSSAEKGSYTNGFHEDSPTA